MLSKRDLFVGLRRQSGDADAAVSFVADVQADEERCDLLEDAGIFQFSAVDGSDAGNLGGEFARNLKRRRDRRCKRSHRNR